jgi:phosphoglycolate phosphatase-like HAD superfamily hydrolase
VRDTTHGSQSPSFILKEPAACRGNMARKQFDLIVFDWDGTLMDSTSTIVKCIQAAAATGLPVPTERGRACDRPGLAGSHAAVLPDVDPKYYPRMVERYRYHYLSRDHELACFPACTRCCRNCRSRRISWRWPPARAGSA